MLSFPLFSFWWEKQKVYWWTFWDGRAATLEEQAGGPPLNPIEMGMKDKKSSKERSKKMSFILKVFKIYGNDIFKMKK